MDNEKHALEFIQAVVSLWDDDPGAQKGMDDIKHAMNQPVNSAFKPLELIVIDDYKNENNRPIVMENTSNGWIKENNAK